MQINCCVPNVKQPSAIRWRIIVEKQHECTNLGTDFIINTNIVSPFKRYKHEIVDTSGENGLSPRGAWFFPEKYSHSGWAQSRCYSTSKVKAGSFWVRFLGDRACLAERRHQICWRDYIYRMA